MESEKDSHLHVPMDVHVNRAPCAGRVTTVQHRDGKFGAAFKKERRPDK